MRRLGVLGRVHLPSENVPGTCILVEYGITWISSKMSAQRGWTILRVISVFALRLMTNDT